MKISSLEYRKRVTKEPYTYEELGAIGTFDPCEPKEAKAYFTALAKYVDECLSGTGEVTTVMKSEASPVTTMTTETATPPEKKPRAARKAASKAVVEEVASVIESIEEVKPEPVAEAAAEEEEEKPKRKKALKFDNYDRTNEIHKTIFVECVVKILPEYRTDIKTKPLVKAASQKLEGCAFLDSEGKVVDTFMADLKVLLGK